MELTPVAVFSEVTPVAVFSAVSGAYVGRLERSQLARCPLQPRSAVAEGRLH